MSDQATPLPADPAGKPKPPNRPPNRPVKPGTKPAPPKPGKPPVRPKATPTKGGKKPDLSKAAHMKAEVTAADLKFSLEGPMDQVMAILNAIYESPTPPSPAVISKLKLIFGPEVRIKG